MNIPVQLIIFSIPSFIYLAFQQKRGKNRAETFARIGWQLCSAKYFLWGLGLTAIMSGSSWLLFQMLPADVWQNPNVNISNYAGQTRSVSTFLLVWLREAIYVTLGEEIFFRGFLGGWLISRFGFAVGNTIQAGIFLLPHLLLLTVSLALWPIIPIQFLAGWLLGWLRYWSDSILPGWLAHSLTNSIAAFITMSL